jgi:hypothetical protein
MKSQKQFAAAELSGLLRFTLVVFALGSRRFRALAGKDDTALCSNPRSVSKKTILEIPGISNAKAVIMESLIILSWHIAEGMCWSLVGA